MRLRAILVAALFAGCTTPAALQEEVPADASPTIPGDPRRAPPEGLADARVPLEPSPAPPSPPAAETLVAPQADVPRPGARVGHEDVRFVWGAAESSYASPITYALIVNDRVRCEGARLTTCTIDVEQGRTHAWSVRATTSTGLVAYSALREFRANAVPTVAQPEYPPRDSHSWSLGDEFVVRASTDADGDALTTRVHVQERGQARIITCDAVGGRCAPAAELEPGARYTWWTTTTDGFVTVESARVDFRANRPPELPILLYPPENSHEWMPGDSFRLTGLDDPDGDEVTVLIHYRERPRGSWRTCEIDEECELDQGEAYEWYASVTDGKLTVETGIEQFRTNAPPDPFEPYYPEAGQEQVPTDLTLVMSGSGDPDGDEIRFSIFVQDDQGRRVAACNDTPFNECDVVLPRHGATYTATVIVTDALGLSAETRWSFTTRRPIVFIHGWGGDLTTWEAMADAAEEEGFLALRIGYAGNDDTILEIAATQVQPLLERLLGTYPPDQQFDIVAHSMGGLVSRTLLERDGAVDAHGSEISRWSDHVRTLITVGTPHLGEDSAPFGCWVNGEDWAESCYDMAPDSSFLEWLGRRPASGVAYHAIGGDIDGDDDGLVEIDSALPPFIEDQYLFTGECHSEWYEGGSCGVALTRSYNVLLTILAALA